MNRIKMSIHLELSSTFHDLEEIFLNFFFRCTVINLTGFSSPHKDDVIDTNDRCDPSITSYVEFADCGGAVLEEQPAKTAEAIRLFLQGLGHSESFSIDIILFTSIFP